MSKTIIVAFIKCYGNEFDQTGDARISFLVNFSLPKSKSRFWRAKIIILRHQNSSFSNFNLQKVSKLRFWRDKIIILTNFETPKFQLGWISVSRKMLTSITFYSSSVAFWWIITCFDGKSYFCNDFRRLLWFHEIKMDSDSVSRKNTLCGILLGSIGSKSLESSPQQKHYFHGLL